MLIRKSLAVFRRAGFLGIAGTLVFGVQLFAQRAEIRGNEVFYQPAGGTEWATLTADGLQKMNPRVSPDQSKVAFVVFPRPTESVPNALRIIDTSGSTIQEITPHTLISKDGCPSLVDHQWMANGTMLLVCHKNPSLSMAYKLDLATGQLSEPLRGYAFAASPDGTRIAHVGFIVHFAPRWAKSEYLKLDGKHIFPKGNAVRDDSPQIVRELDGIYRDVHEFRQPFVWSPDNARLAFAEKVFDCLWPAQELNGECAEQSVRYRLVVCETSGTCLTASLLEGEVAEPVEWLDSATLKLGSRIVQLSVLSPVRP